MDMQRWRVDIVLDVNVHTNVTGTTEEVGGALALYLEAVARTLRGDQDDEAELVAAAVRAGLADVVRSDDL